MKVTIPQDPDWKVQRLKRWNKVWEYGLRTNDISKQEQKVEDEVVAAQKEWYVNGDLNPLIDLPDTPKQYFALDMISPDFSRTYR